MFVLANEIFLTVAGILVGSVVDAHVFSDASFTEDAKGRALIHHLCWRQINSTTQYKGSNRLYTTKFREKFNPNVGLHNHLYETVLTFVHDILSV